MNRATWIAGLVAGLGGSAAWGAAGAATVAEWRADLDAVVADIRLHHPAPFTRMGELTFLRQAEALKAAVPGLGEEERTVAAMRLVASIGDGHTQLSPGDAARAAWYPIRVYEFSDGYFLTAVHKDLAELAGAQLLEVGGRPVATAAEAVRDLRGADNVLGRQENLFGLSSGMLMKGLGYADGDGSLRLKLRLVDGRTVERRLQPRPANDPALAPFGPFEWIARPEVGGPPVGAPDDWISAYRGVSYGALRSADPKRPPQFIRRRGFVGQALPDQDAYYIQLNYVGDFEGTFASHFRRWLSEIDQQKPRRLILDIRYNIGGDGSTIPPVVHEFITREKSPPWKEVYLLTGRRTFSAGVMFYDAFVDHVPLTVVGEPAGAPLNHYGDATARAYPATGLRLSVSTLRHQLSDSNDLSAYTRIDVPAVFSFADWAAGRDPAVDPILAGQEMRSIPVIAMADGGAAALKAYRARVRAFGRFPWWAPPPEPVLRQACDALAEQKRLTDALDACRITIEAHPDDWHSWYNLANVQMQAGDKAGAQASYRKVLEVDPDNINKVEITAILARGS